MHISFNYFILYTYTYNLQFTQIRQFEYTNKKQNNLGLFLFRFYQHSLKS